MRKAKFVYAEDRDEFERALNRALTFAQGPDRAFIDVKYGGLELMQYAQRFTAVVLYEEN